MMEDLLFKLAATAIVTGLPIFAGASIATAFCKHTKRETPTLVAIVGCSGVALIASSALCAVAFVLIAIWSAP